MRSLTVGAAVVLMGLTCSSPSADAQTKVDATRTIAALSESIEVLSRSVDATVVQVLTTGYGPGNGDGVLITQRGSGSGVIVDAAGYIVTNAHVVRGASRIRVEVPVAPVGQSLLASRSRVVNAQLVGLDEETDIAVLKIEQPNLRALPFGDSDELSAGELVLAFGSPMGLQNSVSLGVVSAVARQLEPESPMVYVQTDASINPGNSGGPLVDMRGRLVGVNTLIVSPSGANAGLGFAAPSNIVRAVFEQIRKSGRVRRGEIGVRAQTITPVLAAGLGLKRDRGAVLADVAPGSTAAVAGLQAGDIVLTLDGKPIENGRQFHVNLYRRAAGEIVGLEILRGDQSIATRVAIAERSDPLSTFLALADPREHVVQRLGVLALTLEPAVAQVLPLRIRSGVVVASVSQRAIDSPDGALMSGDVLHAVNNQPVRQLQELRKILDSLKPGDPVVLQLERNGGLMYLTFTVE